ncbi:hypothetical protein [Streptomyces olivaceus]|uniref:hypothetical protein n=1 Tax=Streptomyces olivaceus TaxID=47716 RepID=UPI0037155FA5
MQNNHAVTTAETAAEADVAHLMTGKQITLDELAVEAAAMSLRLRQLARAAETPATPVELEPIIESLRHQSRQLGEIEEQLAALARIVEGDVPLAKTFMGSKDPWGAAARGSDREDYGGPAVVPTGRQLLHLAHAVKLSPDMETTTYPEAMGGMRVIWESKAAQARRRRERDAAVAVEVLTLKCETCEVSSGHCVTKNGRISERPHAKRQREAEATVDARLGFLGDNPVAVPGVD